MNLKYFIGVICIISMTTNIHAQPIESNDIGDKCPTGRALIKLCANAKVAKLVNIDLDVQVTGKRHLCCPKKSYSGDDNDDVTS